MKLTIFILVIAFSLSSLDIKAVGETAVRSEITVSLEQFKKLRRFAKNGEPKAQTILGLLYLTGETVTKNEERGLNWLKKAATRGDAVAQFQLGLIYERKGMKEESDRWLDLSADNNYFRAKRKLQMKLLNANATKPVVPKTDEYMVVTAEGVSIDEFLLYLEMKHGPVNKGTGSHIRGRTCRDLLGCKYFQGASKSKKVAQMYDGLITDMSSWMRNKWGSEQAMPAFLPREFNPGG